jgi:hypothetical protein
MANYVLWGKNADGLNAKQEGLVPLETRHKTWDNNNTESLNELMESPTFNEASILGLDAVPTKITRKVFSRKETLNTCPDYLRPAFEDLFQRIDELDLQINYYDLAHNRRKNPPRPELLAKFDEEAQLAAQEIASHWNQYKYLKKRHELVELRREQYTMRDGYTHLHTSSAPSFIVDPVAVQPQLDADIEVLPLGIMSSCGGGLIFRKWEQMLPSNYTENELKRISEIYWRKEAYKPAQNQVYIDFRELEHVYELFDQFYGL